MAISRCDETDAWLGRQRSPLIGFVLPLVNGDLQAAEDVVQDGGPGQAHGNNFTDQFGGETFNWEAVTASGTAATPSKPSNPSGYNPYQGSAGY